MSAPIRKLPVMTILWPSFLMAGVLEMLVFAMVDPGALHGFGGTPLAWSASAVYTLAFFVFWGVIAAASAMTQLLNQSAEEINSRTFR
jgi:hypothetical protein